MPPRRAKMIGRALSMIAARAPWLWPLIRRPVTAFWNRTAQSWDQGASEARTQALVAALDHVGAPRRILEVGAGTGSGARVLATRFPGADISGVDLSAEMIRHAQANVPSAHFEVGDAAALPFPDNSFDLVAQNNVPVYFSELTRVVAPGGQILITSTFGPATPYYTPHVLLRRKLTEVASGQAGRGDWFIGRPS
jgi:malonyl-CoA O-methyltransferase